MSEFQAFFAESVDSAITEEIVVSPRFKDAEGNGLKWKLKSMNEEENVALRKSVTRKVKGKNGQYTPEIDPNEYIAKLVTHCVVYPSLKDAELQKSYGVMGEESLLRKMLLPGEFANLTEKVQEINGFDRDINEMINDVKN